jgi:hypothetical protein
MADSERPTLALRYGRDALEPQSTGAIVKGILHVGSMTLVYGPPKSGKSFLTTDLLVSIAAGDDHWMDHGIVQTGPVVYVTCEGHAGFWKRLQAIAVHRWGSADEFPDKFVLATGRPTLIGISPKTGAALPLPQDVLSAVERCEKTLRAPIVVAIDTVFRSFGGGNVNSSDHMNAYIEAVQRIIDRGIAVALVHHATKSTPTPAGSVSLMGAADTIIQTSNGGDDGSHTWEVEAAKDDVQTDPRKFRLEIVDIGLDPDGQSANSCVVIDMDETVPRTKGRPKKVAERDLLMRLLLETLDDKGSPPNGGVPSMINRVVEVDDWRALFMLRCRPDDPDQTKRQAFRRMIVDLQGANQIGVSGHQVWPI